jgi:hypothetical protein
MRKIVSYITVSLVGATSAFAQTDKPMQRAHHALIYDAARERVLLVGGSTPLDGGSRYKFFDDVWAYNGERWELLSTSGAERSGERLAYDANERRVVSYGGFDGSKPLPDARAFSGSGWQPLPALAERAVTEGGLVYDDKNKRLITFGGWGGRERTHADTWQFASGEWSKIDVAGPGERQAFSMVFDTRRGEAVVFGGMGKDPGTLYGDTWTFDGTAWKQAATTGPSPRHSAGYAYDSKRSQFLLFGGFTQDGHSNELWSWNGKAWTLLANDGPEARGMGQLAYDAKRDRVVLFGGRKGFPNGDLADTWEWDGAKWVSR